MLPKKSQRVIHFATPSLFSFELSSMELGVRAHFKLKILRTTQLYPTSHMWKSEVFSY